MATLTPSFTDEAYRPFVEEVAAALNGKEYLLLELGTTGGVQVMTSGLAIGVDFQKLQGDNSVNVRLLGKGGTLKVIQDAAIALGARVKGQSGGRVITCTTGRSIGIKISPNSSGAQGDIIEVLDCLENI